MCAVIIRTSGASDGVVHAAAYGLVAVHRAVAASTPSRLVVAEAVAVGSPVGQRRDVLPCANGRVAMAVVAAVRRVPPCMATRGEVAPVGALFGVFSVRRVTETNARIDSLVTASTVCRCGLASLRGKVTFPVLVQLIALSASRQRVCATGWSRA